MQFERRKGKNLEERLIMRGELQWGRTERRKQSWCDWREVSNHLEKRLVERIVVRMPPTQGES